MIMIMVKLALCLTNTTSWRREEEWKYIPIIAYYSTLERGEWSVSPPVHGVSSTNWI